jgi:hypothetical protein
MVFVTLTAEMMTSKSELAPKGNGFGNFGHGLAN